MDEDQAFKKIICHFFEKQADLREPISFKSSPSWNLNEIYSKSGLFKKCCIDCSPNSTVCYDAKNKYHIFLNLLKTPRNYEKQHKNSLKRLNSKLFFLLDCEMQLNLRVYGEKILSNKNITKILRKCNRQSTLEIISPKQSNMNPIDPKILNVVRKIESNVQSKRSIKAALIILNYLFKYVFDKIVCYHLHISALKTAHEKQLPIVYILKSNSIMDRIILQMTLFINNLRISNVLWCLGKNVLDYTLSHKKIFKYLLGLMNFRVLSEHDISEENQTIKIAESDILVKNEDPISIQREIFTRYLFEELKNENSIMLQNDRKFLQSVVKFLENELIHDVLIVPASVNYETCLNDSFGQKSFCQIIFKWLKLILNGALMGKTHGQIRVNFGQPFSLNEFIVNQKEKLVFNKLPIDWKLEKHLNFDISQTESIMCTNIIAFILAIYHPTGCNLIELCKKILEIRKNLAFSYQIGFNYNSIEEVALYGLQLLSDLVAVKNISESQNNYDLIKPRNEKSIKKLFYHGKTLVEIFFLKGIIAKSINQLVKHDLHYVNFDRRRSCLEINENDLVQKCFELINLFQYEFNMFKKPCETILTRLNKNIVDLVNMDILIDQNAKQFDEKYARLNKVFKQQYDEDDWNSEEEEFYSKNYSTQDDLNPDEKEIYNWKPYKRPKIYKVNRDQISKMMFFARIIDPYIEGYLRCIKTVKSFETNKIYTENEIFKLIENESKKQFHNGNIKSIISTHTTVLQSGLNFCLNVGILNTNETKENDLEDLDADINQNKFFITLNEQSTKKVNKYWFILKSII